MLKDMNPNTSLPDEITLEIKSGITLAGDDYSIEKLKIWYEQEENAYFDSESDTGEIDQWYQYAYFVNKKLLYSKIPSSIDKPCIAFLGPGTGEEAWDLYQSLPSSSLIFIESSKDFQKILSNKFPDSSIVNPLISGDIDLEDSSVDIFCTFSVLHHIANVSHVMEEIYRVLKPGGKLLIKEPCSSMGDWRFPRTTCPNERGISPKFFQQSAEKIGFSSKLEKSPIIFDPLNKFLKKFNLYNFLSFQTIYIIDTIISKILALNNFYWRDSFFKKLGPSNFVYTLTKK